MFHSCQLLLLELCDYGQSCLSSFKLNWGLFFHLKKWKDIISQDITMKSKDKGCEVPDVQ